MLIVDFSHVVQVLLVVPADELLVTLHDVEMHFVGKWLKFGKDVKDLGCWHWFFNPAFDKELQFALKPNNSILKFFKTNIPLG